jgi:hypothetical protein
VNDARSYGQWIADVERPAAQYRGRYQLALDGARALLDQAAHAHDRDVQRLPVITPEQARAG